MEPYVLTEADTQIDFFGHAKALRRAAELVEQGWCQYTSAICPSDQWPTWDNPSAVAFCEAGAFFRALMELGLSNHPARDWDLLECILHMAGYGSTLPRFGAPFNDAWGRTSEEVAAHLRAGAANLERIGYAG